MLNGHVKGVLDKFLFQAVILNESHLQTLQMMDSVFPGHQFIFSVFVILTDRDSFAAFQLS